MKTPPSAWAQRAMDPTNGHLEEEVTPGEIISAQEIGVTTSISNNRTQLSPRKEACRVTSQPAEHSIISWKRDVDVTTCRVRVAPFR